VRYRRLASVVLNVSHTARSRAFYTSLPGKGVDIVLTHGSAPGLKRFGFEVEEPATLDRLAAAFDRLGVQWKPLSAGAMRFIDPHIGVAVDLTLDGAPVGTLGHLVIRSAHYRDSVDFWREVMGFRLSDEIEGRVAFLRCFPNPLHHSLAIASGERSAFHHLNLRVNTEREVSRLACELSARGVPIMCGPARHTPTGSRFVYFLDPDGLTLEISAGTEHFQPHAPRAARVLPDRPESFDDGTSPRDPRMCTIGAIEDARR
jgi:2,3-dihydroxy-p-cumate/2,3-dihydroxybenzoate 3,4-dioxygenase